MVHSVDAIVEMFPISFLLKLELFRFLLLSMNGQVTQVKSSSFISLYRNYCTIILNQLYICRAVVFYCVTLYVKFRLERIMRYLYTLYRTSCTINLNFNDLSKVFQNVLRRRSNLKHYNSLYIGLIVLNMLNILFHCVYS